MIRAIIFDCFGVLYTGTLAILEEHCETEQDRRTLHDLSHASDGGFLSRQEFAERAATVVHLPEAEVMQIITTAQSRNRGVFAYAKELKDRGFKVAVLSNFARDSIGRLFNDEDQALFDKIIASGDVGVTKPHISAYDYALRQLNVQPHETIMVDDALWNIDGAADAGLHGVVYINLLQCKAKVEEIIKNA